MCAGTDGTVLVLVVCCLSVLLVFVHRQHLLPMPVMMVPKRSPARGSPDEPSCPFGFASSAASSSSHPLPRTDSAKLRPRASERAASRVRALYEDYVHLHELRCVWTNPVTENPVTEPSFAAGVHGLELGFLLMAEFLDDRRSYVVRRPRVELVARDICAQCHLLQQIVDGGLEDERTPAERAAPDVRFSSLLHALPTEGGPPTVPGDPEHGRQSPGLDQLLSACARAFADMRDAERESVTRVVHAVTAQFYASFRRWTVGIGIEEQLASLRACVGLPPLFDDATRRKPRFLDYRVLVRPHVCAGTRAYERYTHAEDFFFRTVHLGTECWGFVATARLAAATQEISMHRHWHNAAAHVRLAAQIFEVRERARSSPHLTRRLTFPARSLSRFEYLGAHVMMLSSMVLRDYLQLKVEIEGTSGEGSRVVRSFRPLVRSLFEPLATELLGGDMAAASAARSWVDDECASACDGVAAARRAALHASLLELYEHPERRPALYNYAKALECVESALVGGFYFKHFDLAKNVIGSGARGTMKKSVQALRSTYEVGVFGPLDATRAALGDKIDARLAHVKGRIMDRIERRRSGELTDDSEASSGDGASLPHREPTMPPTPPGTCAQPLASASTTAEYVHARDAVTFRCGNDVMRRALYASHAVPAALAKAAEAEARCAATDLAFLAHGWGKVPPSAAVEAVKRTFALYQRGNATWDALFGEIMPEASRHVRRILGAGDEARVEFAHNSHELVTRMLSTRLERLLAADLCGESPAACAPAAVVRVLTTDTEFYSLTRQLNRLAELKCARLAIDAVPIAPRATFTARFAAAAATQPPVDFAYVSQCVYSTQETIVPDVAAFAAAVGGALVDARARATKHDGLASGDSPLLLLDGYHGFGAIPTDLGAVAATGVDVVYVAGMLKHVGAGANSAFAVLPRRVASRLRPLVTGWLADPSVLAPGSTGIHLGSAVGYSDGLALAGATPSYVLPLLTFNAVMRRWLERGVTVELVHAHVMRLHKRFLEGLRVLEDGARDGTASAAGVGEGGEGELPPADGDGGASVAPRIGGAPGGIALGALHSLLPVAHRSHTLVFDQRDAAQAKAIVDTLARDHRIEIDTRKTYVRVGFGFNHNPEDVDRLLKAVAALPPGPRAFRVAI